ncbi:hypothetical protein R3P38DRAFT_2849256 [Favolaschia claudopus]|uniref:Uncharacterized protein n=1 Tax=Favolaschia claudopus TaxID=2862362 RepID=A0AAW0DWI9_9AGAR
MPSLLASLSGSQSKSTMQATSDKLAVDENTPSLPSSAAVQFRVLRAMKTAEFLKRKLWSFDALPRKFATCLSLWSTEQLEAEGSSLLQLLVSTHLRTSSSIKLEATDDEWKLIGEVLTSPATSKALVAATGHSINCLECPLHDTFIPILDDHRSLLVYLGAHHLCHGPSLSLFRIKPWFERHYGFFAEEALKVIRPKYISTRPAPRWLLMFRYRTTKGKTVKAPRLNTKTDKGKKAVNNRPVLGGTSELSSSSLPWLTSCQTMSQGQESHMPSIPLVKLEVGAHMPLIKLEAQPSLRPLKPRRTAKQVMSLDFILN